MKQKLLWLGIPMAISFLVFYFLGSEVAPCLGLLTVILLGAIIINSIQKLWSNVVSVVLIVIEVFVGFELAIELDKLNELNPQMVNAATQVCGGEGLEDAASYDATLQRIHHRTRIGSEK